MKIQMFVSAMVWLNCVATLADDTLEIGAVVGEFYVKDVTGPAAGTELCYRCRYGNRPVVSVFVRNVDDQLAGLISELNGVVGKSAERELAGFVVLMTDDPAGHEASLKALAVEHRITHLPLTIFDDELGPRGYRLGRDAEVTVMMWVDGLLVTNQSYESAELSEDVIGAIVDETRKILN